MRKRLTRIKPDMWILAGMLCIGAFILLVVYIGSA